AARLISTHRVTRFLGVPTQTADLRAYVAAEGLHLDSLEMLGSGGAKRPPADVTPLAETFPGVGVASGWGMTETNAAGATIVGDDYLARPDATGRLLPPLHEVEIRGDDGRALPPGAVGELAVKSPMNMRCYLNQPEATAKTLVDGWLLTGDLATLDAEGYLTILDRKKNIIIRGGENIAALEVEAALHHHPDVIEAGVFPVPDPRLGEIVGACLQVTPGADLTLEKVCTFLDDRLARFKHPARLWTRTAPLTRGATAKTDRRALARECLEENAP
ncbi:MAG: fatty acid--CoA ligase family protein, partial [Pseudomonadota bacterium]